MNIYVLPWENVKTDTPAAAGGGSSDGRVCDKCPTKEIPS